MNRCLYCYRELKDGMNDYHPACARSFFGSATAPLMPWTRKDISQLALDVIHSQTALTGIQVKLSVDIEGQGHGKSGRFTIVGLWGSYILKPQTQQYPNLPENEDVTMHLAKICRIDTVPHTLIRFADGELCYLTRRIDREKGGGKLPMEDMCQITGRLTENKYRGSYEQIAKAIQKHSASPLIDLNRYWYGILFCFLTGNSDMHLKNFSLYAPDKKTYQLTPFYDLLSTVLVIPNDPEELALTLNGKKRNFHKSDFLKAFQSTGLPLSSSRRLFSLIAARIPQCLAFLSKDTFLPDAQKKTYIALISERAQRLELI